jgi:hypothetical protein
VNFDHGEYSILVTGNIIHITCKGAFNEYGVKSCFKEAKELIDSFNGRKFAVITDYSKLEGATPEAFDEVNLNNLWLSKQNIIAKAVVVNSVVIRGIKEKRVLKQKNFKTEFFDSIEKSTEWLLQQ